jgi:L-fuculose-phosphate aldolase
LVVEEIELLRKELTDYGLKAYNAGYITETEGNLSVRLREDRVLVTPSHVPYEMRTPEDMVEMDMQGNTPSDSRNPTSEYRMHLAVYGARSDVSAIVHAHPYHGSILAVIGEPLKPILDEMIPYLGGAVEVTNFAPSGSDELADEVVRALGKKSAAFIANHGSICTGKNLSRAFQTTKYVEKWAEIYLGAMATGRLREIPKERQEQELPYYDFMKEMDW